jgi:hypothetical protein
MPRTRDGGCIRAGIEATTRISRQMVLTETIIRAIPVARVNVIQLVLAAAGVPTGIKR